MAKEVTKLCVDNLGTPLEGTVSQITFKFCFNVMTLNRKVFALFSN